jgi:type I restriction enzyme, S subunit
VRGNLKTRQKIIFKDLFKIPIKNGLFKPTRVRGSGTKMINMGEIFAIDRIFDMPMELVPLTATEEENAIIEKNDLIFARSSLADDAGKCSIFLGNEKTTFESHIIRVRITPKIANSKFYYYYFNSVSGKNLVYSITEKTAASGIRSSDLANLSVPFPTKDVQDSVVKHLEILDIKIENLQNQNKILEQIAQVIFKSWFVDFDRVTEFEDSELGKIPKGWTVVNLEDLTLLRNGKIFQRSNLLENGPYPVYGSNGITGYTEKYLNESSVIVIGRVGVNCGSLYRIDEPSWTTDNSIVIEPNDLNNFDYVYYSLNQMNLREGIRGSAQPLIVQSELRKMKILQPTEVKLSTFSNIISFMSKHIFMNKKNISILTKTRDILLPKLMSGEIRV